MIYVSQMNVKRILYMFEMGTYEVVLKLGLTSITYSTSVYGGYDELFLIRCGVGRG